jgi:hypothetical protein
VNISTCPAVPGDIELIANISPLSLIAILCPNLLPEPGSLLVMDFSWYHVFVVLPSTVGIQLYMYTMPVSLLYPGADTKRYLGVVVLVLNQLVGVEEV